VGAPVCDRLGALESLGLKPVTNRRSVLESALIASVVWLLASVPASCQTNVLSNEWSVAIFAQSDSTPGLGTNGTIYFGTWAGKLWALKPDGSRKWLFSAGNEIKSSPAVGLDGTVYFGCRDRKFYAVGPEGKERWEFPTGNWVDSSPALARDGTVYFGSWDKSFYALDANGVEQWHFKTAGPILSSPAIGLDGTVYFGSNDKKLYALSRDGKKRWEFVTSGAIISSPALNGDEDLYFTSVDGCLYALKLDGTQRWRLRTGGITESSPVIGADGTVYVGVGAHLWAISADGEKKWGRTGDAEYPLDSTPVALVDGEVCCVSRYGWLYYYNSEGVLRYMYKVGQYIYGCYSSPAVGSTGAIYLPDAIPFSSPGFTSLRAGASLARTPWPKFRCNARNTGNLQDATL
jgi:outer membrane protein assembly factor BamB